MVGSDWTGWYISVAALTGLSHTIVYQEREIDQWTIMCIIIHDCC